MKKKWWILWIVIVGIFMGIGGLAVGYGIGAKTTVQFLGAFYAKTQALESSADIAMLMGMRLDEMPAEKIFRIKEMGVDSAVITMSKPTPLNNPSDPDIQKMLLSAKIYRTAYPPENKEIQVYYDAIKMPDEQTVRDTFGNKNFICRFAEKNGLIKTATEDVKN